MTVAKGYQTFVFSNRFQFTRPKRLGDALYLNPTFDSSRHILAFGKA